MTTPPAKTITFLVSIVCLAGLLASPAEAAVKTYYAQQDGTCTTNYNSGPVWQSAAEGGGNCSGSNRIGSDGLGTGDLLITYTPVYASQTSVTGQTGSNIYFTEGNSGDFTGRVRFVEVNAAGNAIVSTLSGEATVSVTKSNTGRITNLSALSGTISAGNRLGMVVAQTNNDGAWPRTFFGNGTTANSSAWFVVDEVVANAAPTLTVNAPNGVTVAEGASYSINYDLADGEDTVTAAFYYDNNNSGLDGTAISGACASAAEGTGATCSWNTTGVPPGTYYIYGITNDGSNPQVDDYSPGTITINDAPALSVSEPNGTGDTVTAGDVYNITYTLTDSDDTITAAFYYDSDAVGFNGTAISACAAAAEGSGVTCAWNTTGMAPGNYYVYGISTTDAYNTAAQTYSSGVITINNATATLAVNQPDGTGDTIAEGGNFTINYNLSDSDNDVTTVAFFYDTNNSGADGTAIGGCGAEPEATGGTCVWNTSGVAPGSYYVYGTTSGDGAGTQTVYSSGTMTINDAPALTVSEPNGLGDTVMLGTAYNITYTLTDSDDTVTAAFFYDTDNVGFNGTAITGACATAAEGTGVTCSWNTTGVTPGSYYVYGISTADAYNSAAQAYSPGLITISSNTPASLVVNQPDGTDDLIAEGGNFTVNYDLSDSDDVTTVSFFYETDGNGADGTVIGGCGTQPEATGGTCVWNTSGVTPGSYYVYGTTSGDGAGATTVVSSGTMTINDTPVLSISEPNGTGDTVTLGNTYNITYTLTDSNDTITVAFYYDSDAAGFNGTPISGACATAAEGSDVTCAWDTTGMTPGDYYVYGISTTDALSIAAQAYSPGVISINSAASLVVNQPDGVGDTIAEGASFTVNYDLSDIDDVTTVEFFYDTNNSGADGTAIGGCAAEPEATGGTCSWNTSGVAPGNYYIYATTSGDGAGATTVYSSGTMTINDTPELSISEPNGTGDTVVAGSVYNITYTLTDSNDTITAAFFYDSDAAGFNGTAISGCGAAAEGSGVTCAWDTTGMTPGDYYVYGISTTDALSMTAQAYSPGVITITPNSAATLAVNEPNGTGDTITEGGSFTINYDLSDSDDVTTVAFFYDTNNSGADGTAIGGCAAEPEATGGTCAWNTGGVEPGSYYVYGTTSGDGAGAVTVYSSGVMTINPAPISYASGDDGTNPGGGDSIAGISRSGGGDDSSNYQSNKLKIDVDYEFKIDFIDDSGESPLVEPKLYIAHRDSPTAGDFFVYPLVCTGASWGSGKTCTSTMKLGPAASHKFYFYAEKSDGTVIRKPSIGYTDGPQIQLINGYSLVGVSRDIDGSNYGGSAAFNSRSSYGWVSAGLDTSFDVTFNGSYVDVIDLNPAKSGKAYFVYKQSGTLPQLGSNADVTAATHTVTLEAGWNLISNPYNGNVKLDDVQIRRNASVTDTWSNAAGSNWIEPAVYYYQGRDWGDTHASVFGAEAELIPWLGYWMYVKDDVNSYELIITKPAQ